MACSYQARLWALGSLFLTTFILAAQAAVPASTYVGQGTSSDSKDNVTVSVNVPSDSSDTLFYHFSAPSSQTWAAFGFGSQMKGALIFVTYASQDGNNVTVSPRLGQGHVMPQHTSDVKVDVLNGSGIVDGSFVVNAQCTGCRSWDGGSVNVDSTSQNMIWALGPSGNLESDDVAASISQHEGYQFFGLNLKDATGTGGVPDATNSTNDDNIDDGPVGDGGPRVGVAFHAFLMVAAFLVVFPAGYLFLRVFEKVWLHWGVQSLALLMVCVGTAAGIGVSIREDLTPSLNSGHQILGFVVTAIAIMTWIVGFIGHRIYKKTGTPAKVMKGHRVLGPSTILFGLINCFVGFNFAGNNRGMIIFGIAMLLMLIFVGSLTFFKRRQKLRKGPMNTPAAMNFREGQMEPGQAGPPPPLYGEGGIPLQSYNAPPVYR
ncbi:hypothetical protein LTR99_010185 [Exophiala xenobiotica]|uniref:DOMON domain-containing protein n=1 Tax=Vermiconidia calcicola TaxID=1690605 RepID=A0AAV9PWL5_9PEZI|nr:hypothetical protein H2202_009011 [Exophiala xenobiotica]KAK5529409.1 hypothetical protein LTR25_009655 [Vermiconidia calcicola]KAK5537994.1 hypothetical protein LTR23_007288 [Chaetothyriales sp. CCFEE 6169]KAK5204258.1 hypothetical protein LTR41_009992 [Exophiala xenobiotica]KAK5227740.1 hypothetical protein LTR47_008547 [Exophiala xenobiotica]